EEDHEPFLGYWGYTIYRTYYGPGSDEQWSKLLENITDGVKKGLFNIDEAEKDPEAVTKAQARFRLDTRSAPATLDGRILEDIQQVYLEGSGGQPMRGTQFNDWNTAIFLLADSQVLKDPDLRVIKVVDANHDPVADIPKNIRCGPQSNFGWITMPTTAVVDSYIRMDTFTFEHIINHAGGGPGVLWDPDVHY
ncbi:hypothetical protein COCCADRAFT_112694, partial [Bipolaris zeicola 26-R-13]